MQRFAFASVALIAVFSGAALAAPASVRVQGLAPTSSGTYRVQAMTVQYDDNDLTTSAGVSDVLARLGKAAEAVCTVPPVRASLTAEIASCQKEAVSRAVATVNSPALLQAAGLQ